jgi:glucose-6-phosphate 1-dehydrogenase
MLVGDYGDAAMYEQLATRLADAERPVFYLAIPPSVFPDVVRGLQSAGLAERGRVIVEKPFGRDLTSARELNGYLAGAFDQDSIFRIDHYLGKESVEGLLAFRFANTFLEPFWNRNHVAGVQITLGESFGTEGRAGFYDGVGAIRDVLQNHLLQVVALLAMEPPIADSADAYRDEEVKVLRQIEPLDPRSTVRGQYVGYLDEEGVRPSSTTETFVSTVLTIESWRWAGVPFHLRTGKHMPGSATEAVVELRRPPRLLFAGHEAAVPSANLVRFRLGHSDGVTLSVQAKAPGARTVTQPVDLRVDFESALGHRREAYERLLDDAMDGRRHRFAREDTIDEEWRIVEPGARPDRPAGALLQGHLGTAVGAAGRGLARRHAADLRAASRVRSSSSVRPARRTAGARSSSHARVSASVSASGRVRRPAARARPLSRAQKPAHSGRSATAAGSARPSTAAPPGRAATARRPARPDRCGRRPGGPSPGGRRTARPVRRR